MTSRAISQYIPTAVAVVFVVAALFFVIASLILNYHWTKYGVRGDKLKRIRTIYFSVSVLIFVVMAALGVFALK